MFPQNFFFPGLDVQKNESVDEGTFSEVYQSAYQGQKIAVKQILIFGPEAPEQNKVIFHVILVINLAICSSPDILS